MFRNMNHQKLIILSVIVFFIASSAWLFYTSQKYSDPAYNSGWWGVYFADPKTPGLNFIIENHSIDENFKWEVLSDKGKIKEGTASVAIGQKENIQVKPENIETKKITIRVSNGTEIREIYRNL
jgi:hypothetical protein